MGQSHNSQQNERFQLDTETYRVHHDWESSDSITQTVIMAVAEVTETDPTEMDELARYTDTDALNRLFKPRLDGAYRQGGTCVTFDYGECQVTVHWDGEVIVNSADGKNCFTREGEEQR